jgi:hypothetical protein
LLLELVLAVLVVLVAGAAGGASSLKTAATTPVAYVPIRCESRSYELPLQLLLSLTATATKCLLGYMKL